MRTRRRRSENLIHGHSILQQVQADRRARDAQTPDEEDEWKPWRGRKESQHPKSREFERRMLGLDEDE